MRNCCLNKKDTLLWAEDSYDEASRGIVSKSSCALVTHDYQMRSEVAVSQHMLDQCQDTPSEYKSRYLALDTYKLTWP